MRRKLIASGALALYCILPFPSTAKDIKGWVPPDTKLIDVSGSGKKAVVVYQYRIHFYRLPAGFLLRENPKNERLRIHKGHVEVDPLTLKPHKTFTFGSHVGVLRAIRSGRHGDHLESNILACTNPLVGYIGGTGAETEKILKFNLMHNPERYRYSYPWENKEAQYKDFCGIISLDGEVIFRFPVKQEDPGTLLKMLGISGDGHHAVIMVGENTTRFPDQGFEIGNFREMLVWTYPNQFKRMKAKYKGWDLENRFRAGKFR